MTTPRRADVFFYGLFMDPDVLHGKGIAPPGAEVAFVQDCALRIGQRAALVHQPNARIYGTLMSLTLDELEQLYAEPSVQAYKAQAVLAHLTSGGTIAALCYNLPEPPAAEEHNPQYAEKLRDVARKVGLPSSYIDSIQ